MTRTAIVGAGAAGLSLAMMLDGDVQVFEKTDKPGGLCQSVSIRGFTFDTGPHILGGIPEAVQWVTDHTPIGWTVGTTNNVGWMGGKFVKHPFEDEIVGERYMAKMWKVPPSELLGAGLQAQAGRKPGGVKSFLYPEHGGYQAITDSWADQLKGKIRYGETIRNRQQFDRFDRVVWTAPRVGRYNSLYVETLCFEGEPPPYTAIYMPQPDNWFHRLSFPGNFSVHNVPDGCFAIQGEASTIQFEGISPDLETVVREMGLVETRPFLKVSRLVHHAYPVPVETPDPPESDQLLFHGRTGAHSYVNLDGVVDMSIKLAAKLNA